MGISSDWAGVVVNAGLAIVTVIGLWLATRNARAAERRADTAESALVIERRERRLARQASHDLQLLDTVMRMHHSASPNVVLMPADIGELRGALDLLGADRLPRTRVFYFDKSTNFNIPGNPMLRFSNEGREDVSTELRDEVRRLRNLLS